jgi:hypothetical protein
MWLWAAASMWFGPNAFSVIDRDRLLRVPVGTVSETEQGIVRVELFDLDDPLDLIRERQTAFREWIGFDDIVARSDSLLPLYSDPSVELNAGSFEHGGVRQLVEWLTGDRLSRRSRADRKRVSELDTDGAVIWQTVEPLRTRRETSANRSSDQ